MRSPGTFGNATCMKYGFVVRLNGLYKNFQLVYLTCSCFTYSTVFPAIYISYCTQISQLMISTQVLSTIYTSLSYVMHNEFILCTPHVCKVLHSIYRKLFSNCVTNDLSTSADSFYIRILLILLWYMDIYQVSLPSIVCHSLDTYIM